jgi:luciferase-type oxidoreductase
MTHDARHRAESALRQVAPTKGHMTIGLELPLDNDWAPAGQASRHATGRHPGEPDMTAHLERATLADHAGFAAIWLRDVPVYDPGFGDAGQVFDPFPYLGYLAAATRNVLLGTAAIALPLRHPLHVAKMAATIDRLSGGRLLLGIASGDRPVEYPLFGIEYSRRGEILRDNLLILRSAWSNDNESAETPRILPVPLEGSIPLIIAGRGGQTLEWLADNLDGYFTYHRPPAVMEPIAAEWHRTVVNETAGRVEFKPLLTTMLVDLTTDPDQHPELIRFGARLGRHALLEYLHGLSSVGVNHVAINLRPSRRPVEEVIQEIGQFILPEFPTPEVRAIRGHHPSDLVPQP